MLYTRLPTDKELSGTGFSIEDYIEVAEVWPENWATFELFATMGTQWRVAATARTGLDYSIVFQLIDRAGYVGDEWDRVFAEIRLLESEALNAMQSDNES